MNFRDVELLSSYLDGRLTPAESARLETRLSSDPALASVMNDLREARSLLRQLPARKAPRNFTLTRKMVGAKPPMPRAYSFLRFATVAAAFVFIAAFALNIITPALRASPTMAYGIGGGSGGGCDSCALEAAVATEAPAATNYPAEAPTEAPTELAVATQPPAVAEVMSTETPQPVADMASAPTETQPANAARIIEETPFAKVAPTQLPTQIPQPPQLPIPVVWQVGLGFAIFLFGAAAFGMRVIAKQKWK